MLETTRIEYLQQMGIVCWIPKKPLDFAPPPRWLATPVAVLKENSDQNQPPKVDLPNFKTLLDNSKPAHNPKVKQPSIEASKPQPKPQEAPNFELCFVRLNKQTLWVCDNLAQKQALQKLVASIMRYQQKKLDAQMPIEFTWPYLKARKQDHSLHAAKRALSAQWQVFIQDGVTECFAFGENSRKWLSDFPVVFLQQELAQVCTQANSKRQLWHRLSEHLL